MSSSEKQTKILIDGDRLIHNLTEHLKLFNGWLSYF